MHIIATERESSVINWDNKNQPHKFPIPLNTLLTPDSTHGLYELELISTYFLIALRCLRIHYTHACSTVFCRHVEISWHETPRGSAAPAHRVPGARDPLKPHPVRQDIHSAQEMTPIDCSLLTWSEAAGASRRKWWVVKTRQFAQWGVRGWYSHECLHQCKCVVHCRFWPPPPIQT